MKPRRVVEGEPSAELSQLAREALWRRGDLSALLHDGQERMLSLLVGNLFVLACIARRWGKTRAACVWLTTVCLTIENAICLYAAPTGKMVREFAWNELRAIAEWAPENVRPVIVGDEMRFPNGSRIIAAGCEDERKADRLRGSKAHAAVIDEGGFIDCLDYVVRSVVTPQLLTTDGRMLVVSTPPTTPEHPFRALAGQAQARGAFMAATLYDAPHLTPQQIERYVTDLGGVDSPDYRREILAEFVVDPLRAIVPEFSKHEAELVSDAPANEHVDRYVVGDLGYVDLSVILFAEWDFAAARIVVVDEVVAERTTSTEIQQLVADKERGRWGEARPYRRMLDAPAITRADMVRLQVGDEPATKWQPVRTDDVEAAVNALRLACGKHLLRIHPRCRIAISHLRNGIWNEKRTAFARSEGLGHFDGVAAMMYLVRHVDRSRNPTPTTRVDRYTQWANPFHREPETRAAREGQKWAKALLGHGGKRRA